MLEHLERRRIKVGLLDFGDGRAFLQAPLAPVNEQFRLALTRRLEAGGFQVVPGDEVIWQNDIAVRNGRRLAAAGVDAVIFNFSVWAWPQYARVAAQFCPQPIAMFSNDLYRCYQELYETFGGERTVMQRLRAMRGAWL